MPVQIEYFHDPFPHCLSLVRLFHGHTFNVRSFCPM